MTQTPPISAEKVEAAAAGMWNDSGSEISIPWVEAIGRPPKSLIGAEVDYTRRMARAALTAAASIPASRGVEPEGWALVPKEPTETMLDKAVEAAAASGHHEWSYSTFLGTVDNEAFRSAWRAMLAASPALPVQEPEPVARYSTLSGGYMAGSDRSEVEDRSEGAWVRYRDHVAALENVVAGFDRLAATQNGIVHQITARAEAAEAKVERLTEALKPFADEADSWHPEQSDATGVYTSKAALGDVPAFTIGDLRAARAALVKP